MHVRNLGTGELEYLRRAHPFLHQTFPSRSNGMLHRARPVSLDTTLLPYALTKRRRKQQSPVFLPACLTLGDGHPYRRIR